MVVHTLRIDFHHGRDREPFDVSMDSLDVKYLEKLLERAKRKETALRKSLEESGATVLNASDAELTVIG